MSLKTHLTHPANGWGMLRWLVVPVIGMDTAITLLGQPAEYWTASEKCEEYNDFFAWFLQRGCSFFLITSAGYIVLAWLVVTLLPRKLALAAFLAYSFGHYMGACSWMTGHFGFGMWLPVSYAVILALAASPLICGTSGRQA